MFEWLHDPECQTRKHPGTLPLVCNGLTLLFMVMGHECMTYTNIVLMGTSYSGVFSISLYISWCV